MKPIRRRTTLPTKGLLIKKFNTTSGSLRSGPCVKFELYVFFFSNKPFCETSNGLGLFCNINLLKIPKFLLKLWLERTSGRMNGQTNIRLWFVALSCSAIYNPILVIIIILVLRVASIGKQNCYNLWNMLREYKNYEALDE